MKHKMEMMKKQEKKLMYELIWSRAWNTSQASLVRISFLLFVATQNMTQKASNGENNLKAFTNF